MARPVNWTLALMGLATVANGLLTGGNIDRLLVATPAWVKVGLPGWADFTRSADLGAGTLVYPIMALGGTGLVVSAAVVFLASDRKPPSALIPVMLAVASMIVALPFSLLAIPFVMSLHHVTDSDLVGLKQAFAGAHFWGRLQSIAHLVAFLAELWAISALSQRPRVISDAR